MTRFKVRRLLLSTLLAPLAAATFAGAARASERSVAYTLTNAAAGNEVAVFVDQAHAPLSAVGRVATQGLGNGGGLGSQGALVLSKNRRWLLAVNAGSNDVSVFRINEGAMPVFASRHPSGGQRPTSIAVHDDLVYVLNAGETGNIAGFRLDHSGVLTPIAGAVRSLSGIATAPAQVGFSGDGETLVVSERATNLLSLYDVNDDGIASDPRSVPSAGQTPFGFAFDKRGHLLVSEAFGGTPNASTLSSYDLDDNAVKVISAKVPTNQSAACWVAITPNGRYAYVTNTASGSVSGFRVARNGKLAPLNADGRTGVTGAGSAPIDAEVGRDGEMLYVLTSGAVSAFRVRGDGSLTTMAGAAGLPPSAVGLAVR